MCQVRLGGKRGGPHTPSDARRAVLRHQQPPIIMHTMPQPKERQGEGWHDWASWTWGDYYEEIAYITYE